MNRGTRAIRSFAMHFVVALAVCAGTAVPVLAQPVDDRFTFQGELRDGASVATGSYDFRFRLYDSLVGGLQIGPQLTQTAPLTDGKFTVSLQFPGAFNAGAQRYIEVECGPAGSGTWFTLSPRQLLSATPNATYAINANSAALATNSTNLGGQASTFYTNASNMSAGTLPSARLTGNYTGALSLTNVANNYFGNGSNLTGLNATNLGSGTVADARLSSNVDLLNTVQSFTASKTFNVGSGTPLTINDTTAGGFALDVNNAGGSAIRINNLAAGLIGYGLNIDVDGTTTKYGTLMNLSGATGAGYGVYQTNSTVGGRGYYASMTGTGTTYGVYISNNNPAGYGGYFNNTSTTGTTYGLYCENNSADGYGLFALHDATTGTGPAVYGRTDSTSASAYAIHGLVNTTTAGANSSGVRGQNNGTGSGGIGVYGSHAGSGWGVYGTSVGGYGVYGFSTDDYGVRGYSTNSYGGHFDTGVSGGVALYVVGTASVGVLQIRGGADLAENFEVSENVEDIQAGMLVMIDADNPGKVELARGSYNKCVAGVISGANELNAGMILGSFEGQKDAKPVALTGRVWTYVVATDKAVEPGDLLTTSDTPGYAMPVTDNSRAHGATIGKAMSRLEKGEKGMVLVLVNLQ